jgi:hypothetical protein
MGKFKNLSQDEIKLITVMYKDDTLTRSSIQKKLGVKYGVEPRTIRDWANKLGLIDVIPIQSQRIMIYDIETSRTTFNGWWTGKQYVGHNQIIKDPSIISIAWKWLGESKVYTLNWTKKNHCDKKMMEKFLVQYNSADMVVGQNNNRFDNRWVNARAMFHGLFVNTMVKSFDIMKETKRLFRLPSYSMAYISKYMGITQKLSHEGILMWEMIESGTKAQQAEYLQKMLDYNIGDIVTTEEMYLRLRKYMGQQYHFGKLLGAEKYTCPDTGSSDIEVFKTVYTKAGTLQHLMKSNETGSLFKLSNREYMSFLRDKIEGKI